LKLNGFQWDLEYLKNNSPECGRITFLSLEMGPFCNARCLYCFSGPEINTQVYDHLSLEEYKESIRCARNLGAKTLLFPGIGEPTLDKKLKAIISFANGLGLVSVVYTHGVLDLNTIQFLKNHNTSLILKVDSLNSHNYERLVGLPYSKFRTSLKNIIRIYRNTSVDCNDFIITHLAANTVVTLINKDEVHQIRDFCQKYHIIHFVENLSKVGNAKKNWHELVGNDQAELAQIVSEYDTWVSSATVDGKCGLFCYGVTIDANGDMIGCPTARWIRLGNIRNSSLPELVKIYKFDLHNSEKHYCLARELSLKKAVLSR